MSGYRKYKYYKGRKIDFSITGTDMGTSNTKLQNDSSDIVFSLGTNLPPNETIDNIYTIHIDSTNPRPRVVKWNNKPSYYDSSFDLREYTGNRIDKNINRGIDGNSKTAPFNETGFYFNKLYLSEIDRESITRLAFEAGSNIYIVSCTLNSPFPNLKIFEQVVPTRANFTVNIDTVSPGKFPESLATNAPNLEKLSIRSSTSSSAEWTGLPLLTSLKYLRLHLTPQNNNFNIFSHLPPNIYYFRSYFLSGITMELSEYYTGNRVGLYLEPQNNVSTHKLTYTGKAIFPSVISEDPNYPIDYIYFSTNNIKQKLTPTEVSKFLMDFANQVTSVTTSQKIIRMVGMTPNTSYEDLSQPLFTTYASALAHITGTLKVTVRFT